VATLGFPARRRRRLVGAAILVAGCVNEPAGVDRAALPAIDDAAVQTGPHNVLSAVVSARLRQADSAAVSFRLDEPAAGDSATPAVAVVDGSVTIPVLGLLPDRRYALHVIAYGKGGTVSGSPLAFTTGALPPDLPTYSASGADPSPGYVVFAAGRYGLVIDNTGRVVWYRYFANGPGLNFMAQPTGRYVVRPPTVDPSDIEPWLELDPLGEVVRTFGCAGNLQSRFHDLISRSDGTYWIMCDEARTMDISTLGGSVNARVTGTVVQHVGADGALLLQWSPFDHFAITDLDPADLRDANVNWTHGNALDLDADGNLIVSFRSLNEITKIDATNGAVIWRMGGRANQFTFLDTPLPAFSHQHGARLYAGGTLLILDNLGDPTESRAERYEVDQTKKTARLVQSYGSTPGVLTQIGGSVQALPGDRTIVSFGTTGRVEEYDATGRLVWHIDGNAGYVFRAQRIRSLYAPTPIAH
jgi:arylsulfotransferase ASST